MYGKKSFLISCFLLAVLSQFFFVKAFHVHKPKTEICCHHHSPEDCDSQDKENCPDKCQICHILVTPFIQSPSLSLKFSVIDYSIHQIISVENVVCTDVINLRLRAPPVC